MVAKKKLIKKASKPKAVSKSKGRSAVNKIIVKTNKTQTKTNKTQTKTNKAMKKSINANKKKTESQSKEIEKLKKALEDLKKKKKTNTRRVSEYNLFIRKQIKSGLTFERSVKEWNKFKKLELKLKRKPSAYNQFIGSQMKLGKTFTESVEMWKLAKQGKLGRKGKTRLVTKTVVKNVRSKPKIVEKTKHKIRVKKNPRVNQKIVRKNVVDYNKIKELFSSIISNNSFKNTKTEQISIKDIKSVVEADNEEIAFKLVQTYFIEIARFGFKKQLTLDEIIDAYIYALVRVKGKEGSEFEIAQKVKESGMRK
ncbi:MAG: hypothetical protein PHP82_02275 [Candidatus ainarchaeum sp.]|nr:hypothetical protein [Candidatus ainarchaeum sp.]